MYTILRYNPDDNRGIFNIKKLILNSKFFFFKFNELIEYEKRDVFLSFSL